MNKMNRMVELQVEGYKSIYKNQRIKIAPLTILAGANSSGKSSFLQPLLLMKQTLEAPFDPGIFLLDGENVKISRYLQLFTRIGENRISRKITLKTKYENNLQFTAIYQRNKVGGVSIKEQRGEVIGKITENPFVLKPRMSKEKLFNSLPDEIPQMVIELDEKTIAANFRIVRRRCFLTVDVEFKGLKNFGYTTAPGSLLKNQLEKMIHVPCMRGNPERTYKKTAIGYYFPGRFDNYVASLVYSWQQKEANEINTLHGYLQKLGLTWEIRAEKIDDSKLELLVSRSVQLNEKGPLDFVNIADVGFGVSQVLPVLVALIAAKKGSIIYIEQPEIHLHPKAKLILSQIIAEAASKEVTIIVETHSSIFLRSIQTAIALNNLEKNDVVLHWFSRDTNTGLTKIHTAELEDDGSFGNWPEDFDDVILKVEEDYLDAVERRE
jgi:predicted ATPase